MSKYWNELLRHWRSGYYYYCGLWSCLFTAFRIHISGETKEKLEELGGYHIQYRGEVELKVAYWLSTIDYYKLLIVIQIQKLQASLEGRRKRVARWF